MLKNEKGMVMILVLLGVAIMFLGATFLINIGLLDYRIALNKEKYIYSLYLAEAGIETGLGLILEHDLDFRGEFQFNSGSSGSFKVDVSQFWGTSDDKWVEIVSEGNLDDIKNKISLHFQISPSLCSDAINGAELDWFDYESGAIIIDNEAQEETSYSNDTVIFESNAQENGITVDIEDEAVFSAPAFFFTGDRSLDMHEGKLSLFADKIVFWGEIYGNCAHAPITFSSFNEHQVKVYFLKPFFTYEQALLVLPGTYLFPDDFTIEGNTSFDEIEQYRISPIIAGSEKWTNL